VYLWAALSGEAPEAVRALTFATLVVGNLGLIFVNRSWTHSVLGGLRMRNRALWYVTFGTITGIVLLFSIPATRDLFQFAVVHPADFLVAGAAGVLSVGWFEVYKMVRHKHHAEVA
jgi:Ca2+-transporting ATPase